jgi:hypothetical protein
MNRSIMIIVSISFAILLLLGTPLYASAKGSNDSPKFAACHQNLHRQQQSDPLVRTGGYNVNFCVVTGPGQGPANGLYPLPPSTTPAYLFSLQGMVIEGSCDLTGGTISQGYGTSGVCTVFASVSYSDLTPLSPKAPSLPSSGTSVCRGTIVLGNSPNLKGAAWVVVTPSQGSGLAVFYGKAVSDFRLGWNSATEKEIQSGFLGPTSQVCSMFLFDGTSADLFIPAQVGHFNFSGLDSVGPADFNFGAFTFYNANVSHFHHEHHSPHAIDRN